MYDVSCSTCGCNQCSINANNIMFSVITPQLDMIGLLHGDFL